MLYFIVLKLLYNFRGTVFFPIFFKMSNTNESDSNLPADFNCEENDQVGSSNLIGNVNHSNLLPDCDNPGK